MHSLLGTLYMKMIRFGSLSITFQRYVDLKYLPYYCCITTKNCCEKELFILGVYLVDKICLSPRNL